MKMVMNALPDVSESQHRNCAPLYRRCGLGAQYKRSLDMLRYAKQVRPYIPTKSGLDAGLGRNDRRSAAGDA